MMDKLVAIIVVAVLIILLLCVGFKTYTVRAEHILQPIDTGSYIKLYEGYNQSLLAFETSSSAIPGELSRQGGLTPGGYIRQIIKIHLKSVDINLPALGNDFDAIRRVSIWAINDGDPTASDRAGFYNSYLEPESELRSNPAKYQQVLQVLPGDHVKVDIAFPVKKIFLIATL